MISTLTMVVAIPFVDAYTVVHAWIWMAWMWRSYEKKKKKGNQEHVK